jgi:transposase
LKELNRLVIRNKGISAKKAKLALNLNVSTVSIVNYWKKLGWKKISTKYCQFVSVKNQIERVVFANFCLIYNETFEYVIFLDECTVEMVYEPTSYWYRSSPSHIKLVGKYQHEASVHIIGAISRRGRSNLMIFSNNLNSTGFQVLCDQFLIPFVREKFPIAHRVQMDNARVHVSEETFLYFMRNQLNHFRTPAQSPDLNPIELVWNDLKYFLANEAQPRNVQGLVNSILYFWHNKVTIEYCNSKINHLNKVLRRVIELNGKATGI